MELYEARRNRHGVNLDIGPLLDMVFILLIFFIVTSTFTRETGVEVTKPTAASASEVNRENILIAITREGTVHVNDRQVDVSALKDLLERMVSQNPAREVVLVADRESNTGLLVKVVDACNLAGARKVSIAAQNE